jgi:hypothetical protein
MMIPATHTRIQIRLDLRSEAPVHVCSQVEHPFTEAIHPGLDLVSMMIQQGLAESGDSIVDV